MVRKGSRKTSPCLSFYDLGICISVNIAVGITMDNCDCPYVMKKQACENALKTKERNERPIRKVQNVSNSETS